MDGLVVWRFVRSLEPNAVEVELTARSMPDNETLPPPVVLRGWRRRYADSISGVISAVYRPGELTQSLCSPWQHDFRDCGCFYWASIILMSCMWKTATMNHVCPPVFQQTPLAPWNACGGCGPTGLQNVPPKHARPTD